MKYKVLMVDDQESLLEVFREFLEDDFEVITALNTDDAFRLIEENHQQLAFVICDYQLVNETGFDLRSKMLGDYQEIPFAILSGFLTKELALQGIDLSICAFIEKPCPPQELIETVHEKSKSRVENLEEEAEMIDEFQSDAKSILESIESGILDLEGNGGRIETIDGIMRLLHTIKGTSACLGQEKIAHFSHSFEDFFGPLKREELPVTPSIVSRALDAFDILKKMIDQIKETHQNFPSDGEISGLFQVDPEKIKQEHQEQLKSQSADSQKVGQSISAKEEEISVSMALLNEFMEQSGELTVLRSIIVKHVKTLEESTGSSDTLERLVEALDEMHNVSASIQAKIVEIRKVPLKNSLKQLPRVVRDACKMTEKKVNLSISGQDLRVDHAIDQALTHSLVHVIRNSIDHGIESTEVRQETDKPDSGAISVDCSQQGDEIIIEVSDDGQGVDPEKIKEIVLKKNLFTEHQLSSLTPQKIQSLIFEPGFSTAQTVTDLSGRGVGMDMVRTSVEELGGHIKLDSQVGQGTRLKMRFPTPKSVLIIKSLFVELGSEIFAINQDDIVRVLCFEAEKQNQYIRHIGQKELLVFEGNLLPILDIEREFDLSSTGEKGIVNLIILRSEKCCFALKVSRISDNEEIVVKPLNFNYSQKKIFAGATFLGDGQVTLVFDCNAVSRHFNIGQLDQLQTLDEDHTEDAFDSTTSYLLVKDRKRSLAIPLENVHRLEKIKSSQIESVGREMILRYEDTAMPLLTATSREIRVDEEVNVVVFQHQNFFYGTVVDDIVDIISDEGVDPLQNQSSSTVESTILFQEKIYEVLDLEFLVSKKQTLQAS